MKKIIVTFVLLLSFVGSHATAKSISVDTVRVTYYSVIGYGSCRMVACYALKGDVYECQNYYGRIKDSDSLPKTINKELVLDLQDRIEKQAQKDSCKFVKITSEDYSNYVKMLNDSFFDSTPLELAGYKDKEKFKLNKRYFTSLSGGDIFKNLSKPFVFGYSYSPLRKIEFVRSDGEVVSIKPVIYPQCLPWKVSCGNSSKYISFESVLSFLEDAQLSLLLSPEDKYLYMLHIAYVYVKSE